MCWTLSLLRVRNFIKKRLNKGVLLSNCQNFKNTYVEEHLRKTTSACKILLVFHPFPAPILYSRRFPGVSKGYKMGTLATNGLSSKGLQILWPWSFSNGFCISDNKRTVNRSNTVVIS